MLIQKGVLLLACAVALSMAATARQTVPNSRVVTEVVTRSLPFTTQYVFDRNLGPGRVRNARVGQPGLERTTYEVLRNRTGRELGRVKVSFERVAPRNAVYGMGRAGHTTSRSGFTRSRVKMMESTAYTPCAGRKNPTFKTRMGLPARFGVIAVDPRVIRLGTLVFVEGYGFAIAADTGGAIKGNIIDVCLPTLREVRNWGRRTVRVHIFNETARR